jgi:molybdopterin-guanine dinucleotide biosynthesis protein A
LVTAFGELESDMDQIKNQVINQQPDFAWIILAGGQGRRMGLQDKGWLDYQGQTLITALTEQLSALNRDIPIIINANQNIEAYKGLGYPVITDAKQDFQGPLSGILNVMKMSSIQPKQAWLTWPVDAPFRVEDYLQKIMISAPLEVTDLAVAKRLTTSAENIEMHLQYTHLLIKPSLQSSLQSYLQQGRRSIKGWIASLDAESVQTIAFNETDSAQWINLNQPEDFK